MIEIIFWIIVGAAYIGAGAGITRYLNNRYQWKLGDDGWFWLSLCFAVTGFMTIFWIIADQFAVDHEAEKHKRENKLIQLRIEQKQLLQAEQDLDNEMRKNST